MEEGRIVRVYVSKDQNMETCLKTLRIAPLNVSHIKIDYRPDTYSPNTENVAGISLKSGDFVNIYLGKGVYVDYCPHSV